MTPARKALAAAILAVVLFAAVIVQLTMVNRLPFPGGAVPDLVLLLVTAIAVTTTPALAAVTGFAGGLALDVAPPAAHYAGEYALVFCLAAYAAARVNRAIGDRRGERDQVTAFTVMAIAAAAGESGKAALGLLLSDPDVTTAAVSHVLPGAILYDLVLSPLAFWLVALVTRGRGLSPKSERAPVIAFSGAQHPASVFRQASAGAAPKLHLAGTGAHNGARSPARRRPRPRPRPRFAGTGRNYAAPSVAGRVPRLRLSDGPHSIPGTAAAFSDGSSSSLAAGRAGKLRFGGDLPVHAVARPARTPGRNWLRSAAPPAPGRAAHRPARGPSRGWLRPGAGSITGRGGSGSTAAGYPAGREVRHPRRFAAGRPGAARSAALTFASQTPRKSADALAARNAPSGLSALSGAGTPLSGRRAPRAGWLSGSRSASAPLVRKAPRTGWLGRSRGRPRTVIGSTVRGRAVTARAGVRKAAFRRRRALSADGTGGTGYAAFPPRGRGAWRERGRRLLRMTGVSK